MKDITILIPVYNDWESLKKLILEIDESIKEIKNFSFKCIIVNDASTIEQPKLFKPKNIKSLKILNMFQNKGHARCNAFGIRYINQNEKFDFLILMDGDGEDRPTEIKDLVNAINENKNTSIVAKRIKRSEGPFFQFLYFSHKLLTYISTGQKINFGNYSCLTKQDVEKLSSKSSLWSSFSGTVKKNLSNLTEIDSIRGIRYFGPTKMSLYKLIIHSLSIIAVFKNHVFLRSIFLILILQLLKSYFGYLSLIFQILIIIFNSLIFLVSLREKHDELINSQENLKNITIINQ